MNIIPKSNAEENYEHHCIRCKLEHHVSVCLCTARSPNPAPPWRQRNWQHRVTLATQFPSNTVPHMNDSNSDPIPLHGKGTTVLPMGCFADRLQILALASSPGSIASQLPQSSGRHINLIWFPLCFFPLLIGAAY